MKHKLGFVLLFISNVIFSQSSRVEKKDFESAVNYVNCRIIEFSLKGYNNDPALYDKFKSQYPNNLSSIPSYENIKPFFKENPKIDKTKLLSEEVNKLKDSFDPNWNDSKDIISLLTEDLFRNSKNNPELSSFFDKRKDKGIKDFQNDLKKELKIILAPTQVADGGDISDLKTQISGLRSDFENFKRSRDKSVTPSLLSTLLFVGFVIILILVTYLFYKTIKLSSSISRIRDKVRSFSLSDSKYINNNPSDFSSFKRDIESELKQVYRNIEKLKEAIEKSKNNSENTKVVEVVDQKPLGFVERIKEVFYFPSPNKDGSFNDSDKLSEFKESESLYIFSILQNNRAEFSIVENSSSLKMALNLPDTYIKPVCESLNSFFPGASNIKVTTPGIAFKESDKWIVTSNNKAKIIYV